MSEKTAPPGAPAFTAVYFDGLSAARTPVIARREWDTLVITDREGGHELRRWPIADLIEHREERGVEVLVIGPEGEDARIQIVGGGLVRDARAALPTLRAAGVPAKMIRKVGLFTVGAFGSVLLLLFVILPALADQMARLIPPEREVAFGESVERQVERFFGAEEDGELFCTDEDGLDALEVMTARVMGTTTLPYPLEVKVFDHSLVNAFALPGGHVVLFRGLVEAAEHPDEVAAVLAHEIGHVAARDPTRIALQAAGSAGLLGLVLGDFAGGTIALTLANQLVQANYSQEAELAADAFAVARMQEAGLPPDALAVMFERLREEHGDVSGIASHFMSHPQLVDRIEAARNAEAPSHAHAPSLSDGQWADLRRVCND